MTVAKVAVALCSWVSLSAVGQEVAVLARHQCLETAVPQRLDMLALPAVIASGFVDAAVAGLVDTLTNSITAKTATISSFTRRDGLFLVSGKADGTPTAIDIDPELNCLHVVVGEFHSGEATAAKSEVLKEATLKELQSLKLGGEPYLYLELSKVPSFDPGIFSWQPAYLYFRKPIESNWHSRPVRKHEVEIQFVNPGASTADASAALKFLLALPFIEPGTVWKESKFAEMPWLTLAVPDLAAAKRPQRYKPNVTQWKVSPVAIKVDIREAREPYKVFGWFGESIKSAKADIQKEVKEHVLPEARATKTAASKTAQDKAENDAFDALAEYIKARDAVKKAKADLAGAADKPAFEAMLEVARHKQTKARLAAEGAYKAAGLAFPANLKDET